MSAFFFVVILVSPERKLTVACSGVRNAIALV